MSGGEDHIVIPASGPRLSISTANTPQTLYLRIQIARLAMDFFDPEKPNTFAEALGKPDYDRDSLTGEDFRQYMLESADFFSSLHSIFVLPVLREMVRANLLHDHGVSRSTDGLLGHAYRTVPGAITNSQRSGSLWLSRVLGPELIIANYEAVTVHIVGKY